MRISDWSSDVCSSDLLVLTTPKPIPGGDGALLAALARPATIQDDRLAAVDADFSQLPKFGAPGTIVSQTALPGLRAERIEFANGVTRSEEHTSELQSLMRISYAVFCLKKKNTVRHSQNT